MQHSPFLDKFNSNKNHNTQNGILVVFFSWVQLIIFINFLTHKKAGLEDLIPPPNQLFLILLILKVVTNDYQIQSGM
jgi:hypothetical protein